MSKLSRARLQPLSLLPAPHRPPELTLSFTFTTAQVVEVVQGSELCGNWSRGRKSLAMLSWLHRRRAKIERIDFEAEALIRQLGFEAYSEARRMEREASSEAVAKDWSRIATAIAHKFGRRIGVDTSTRMAINAIFAPDRKPASVRQPRPLSEPRQADELMRVLATKPQTFRIQFVGAGSDRGTSILKEVEIQASDVSAAIIAGTNLAWPPQTIGLRILDREAREVFGRKKAYRR